MKRNHLFFKKPQFNRHPLFFNNRHLFESITHFIIAY